MPYSYSFTKLSNGKIRSATTNPGYKTHSSGCEECDYRLNPNFVIKTRLWRDVTINPEDSITFTAADGTVTSISAGATAAQVETAWGISTVFLKANGTDGPGSAIDASTITEGTLDDARLSSNVPFKVGGKIQAADLPAYVDDVLEYANLAAFPGTGIAGIIYVDIDTNKTYRWSGSAYIVIANAVSSLDDVPDGTTRKLPADIEVAATKSAVSASTAKRLVYVTADETQIDNNSTLYIHNGTALKLLQIISAYIHCLLGSVNAQTPQTPYVVTSISAMKNYFGAANKMYVSATNEDYVICSNCTADEVTIYAGAGGRKWQKVIDASRLSTARHITDSSLLRGLINTNTTSLNVKLNTSDTGSMLSVYRTGIIANSASVATKYGSSDTGFAASLSTIGNRNKLRDSIAALIFGKEGTISAPNTSAKYLNGYKAFAALNADSLTNGSTNMFEVTQGTMPSSVTGRLWVNNGFPSVPNTANTMIYQSGQMYFGTAGGFAPITELINVTGNVRWYGDSWTANFGLASANNGFVNKVSNYRGWLYQNGGVAGTNMYTTNHFQARGTSTFLEIGINDAKTFGYAGVDNYNAALRNYVAYGNSYSFNGQQGVKTTPSDWVVDSVNSNFTIATRTTVDNSPITFSLPISSAIYVSIAYTTGSNVTYDVTIDGVSQGTYTAAPVSYITSGTNPNSNFIPYCHRFPAASGNHTVVLKKTGGTGQFRVLFVGSNHIVAGSNGTYVLAPGKMTPGTAGVSGYAFWGGSDSVINRYIANIYNVINELANDGLATSVIDINKNYDPHLAGHVQADSLHPADLGATVIANQIISEVSGNIRPNERQTIQMLQRSASQGYQLPTMTSAIRDVILFPTSGRTIFCTDCTATDASTGVTQTYNGTTWKNHW